jgi:hypothetical protein
MKRYGWGMLLLSGLFVYLLASRAGITHLPIFRLSGKMLAVVVGVFLVRRVMRGEG